MKDECKLITLQEVADALCTTRQTVSNWCSFGVFKTRKIGKCIYIDRDTFDVVRDSLSDLERTKESIRELKHDFSEMKKFLRCQQAEIKAAIGVVTRIGRPSRLGGIVKPLCDLAYSNNDPVSVKKGYKILQMLAEGKTLQFIAKNVFHCSIAALTFDAARAMKKLSRLQNYTSLVEENKSLKEDLLSLQTRFSFIFDENIRLNAIVQNEISGDLSQKFASAKDMELYRLLTSHVSTMHLSVRATNALRIGEVETIGELVQFREKELVRLRNMGRRTVLEIKDKLTSFGLGLEMDVHPLFERVRNALRYKELKSNGVFGGFQSSEPIAAAEGCNEDDTSERALRPGM